MLILLRNSLHGLIVGILWRRIFLFRGANWSFQALQQINISYLSTRILYRNCLANKGRALRSLPSAMLFYNFSAAIVQSLPPAIMMSLSEYNSCCLALSPSTASLVGYFPLFLLRFPMKWFFIVLTVISVHFISTFV